MDKRIYVFAVPNGSGKSTVIQDFLEGGICPSHYICPDNFVPKDKKADKEAYLQAMQEAEELRNALIEKGEPFTFETVLSMESKVDFLTLAKSKGYKVTAIYIVTSDYDINIKRVDERVKNGGHGVPEDKLIARYERCMSLMKKVIDISDEAIVYDNSSIRPFRIYVKSENNEGYLLNREQRHSFFDKVFVENGIEYIKDLSCVETEEFLNPVE